MANAEAPDDQRISAKTASPATGTTPPEPEPAPESAPVDPEPAPAEPKVAEPGKAEPAKLEAAEPAEPETAEPETAEPETAEPAKTGAPEPETAEPEVAEPIKLEAAEPPGSTEPVEAAEPATAEAAEPTRAASPEPEPAEAEIEPAPAAPRAAQPEAAQPEAAQPEAAQPEAAEPEAAEPVHEVTRSEAGFVRAEAEPARAETPVAQTPVPQTARAEAGTPDATPAEPREPAADIPEAPATAPTPPNRKLVLLIAAAVVLLAATAAVTVQFRRTLPAAHLTTTLAQTLRIPGPALALPWPRAGSADLVVEGLGHLGGSHAATRAPIGSVAKVMTAYLILRHHPLTGTEPGPLLTVTGADVADYQARVAGGQSLVKVAAGERITERQALEALLLPSANNIAHLLGVWDAGSAPAFVTGMNDAAAELGMTGTRYTDPSGFLPSTVSTPADQVALARAALRLPVFADIVAEPSATIPVAGRIRNYNTLLGRDGVFGIKTGSTSQAGGNLVFASRLRLGGTTLTVIGAVFNQPGAGTPAQLARVNTVVRQLLTSVRSALHRYPIRPATPIGRLTTAWGARVSVSPAAELKVIGWPGLRVPVRLTAPALGATARSGTVVGQIEAGTGANAVRVDVRADASTGEPSWWWRLTRS